MKFIYRGSDVRLSIVINDALLSDGWRQGECDYLKHGNDDDMYTAVDGVLTPKTSEEVQEIISARADAILKAKQETTIRDIYAQKSILPVEVTVPEGTWAFNGGIDSYQRLIGAVTLSQMAGEDVVVITDIDNEERELSNSSALEVARTIGLAWRAIFFAKQRSLRELQ